MIGIRLQKQFVFQHCHAIYFQEFIQEFIRYILVSEEQKRTNILDMVTEIVAAHVSNNSVAINDIPRVINKVYVALNGLSQGANGAARLPEPAVPIKKSVHPDFIICLEDGKKLKMMKRHLRSAYGLTPDQYREKWGLGADYPMVAPNYAKKRSSLARQIGLGTGGRKR
jgi:predicted transcriptional regulator